jgi:hypothetical protein
MSAILPLLLLLVAPAPAEVRTLTATISDEKGATVEGLVADDLVVLENGVAREVVRAEADKRPLTLALILDASEPIGSSFRLNLSQAVSSFIDQLPEGTTYTLWTTSDRANKVVGPTADRAEGVRAIGRLFPRGGNTLLDTLVEASKALATPEGQRSAIVVVTAVDPELSYRDRQQVVDQVRGRADVFMAVQFEAESAATDDRIRFDYVLGALTGETGGVYERPLSAMGVAGALRNVSAAIRAPYRLSYATLAELKERKLEVNVARPGVKVRVWPAKKKP